MRWILAVLSLLVCCQQSRAFSGIELYKICSGPYLERNQENICFGYIRGFSEGYYMGIAVQAELIVKKYMTNHPEELNKPAFFIVQNALSEAFGCRSK
jgi:Rap1a immunity proteins